MGSSRCCKKVRQSHEVVWLCEQKAIRGWKDTNSTLSSTAPRRAYADTVLAHVIRPVNSPILAKIGPKA